LQLPAKIYTLQQNEDYIIVPWKLNMSS
jgi:hypothetical protein